MKVADSLPFRLPISANSSPRKPRSGLRWSNFQARSRTDRPEVNRGCGPDRLLAHGSGDTLLPVEFRTSLPDLVLRQALDVAVIELPVRPGAPNERGLDGGPRGGRRLEQAQSEIEGQGLRRTVARTARGIAERKVREQKAGNADMLDDVLGTTHDDGGDAVRFEHARRQADALMTNRTVGNEDRGIDRVGLAANHDLRAVGLERDPVAAIGRQTMKAWSNRADPAACRPRPQLGEREVSRRVLDGGVHAVHGNMREAQVV